MRVSQRSRRHFARSSKSARSLRILIDALESRRLFSGETALAIPPVLANTANPSTNALSLGQYFTNSTLPGTLVTFSTTFGNIDVGLTDSATPATVANFLSYIGSNAYNGTIFHRSVNLNTGQGGTPTSPATIIQGGGYAITTSNGSSSINHIPTNAPLQDEYLKETLKDVAGTLAMAKTSNANTATSEFYFNVSDNTELDTPTTDSNGVQTSYTVFGQVLGSQSMQIISAIAALPTTSALGNGLDTVPVTGLTEAQLSAGVAIAPKNLIFTNSITEQPGTTYTATSDNKALVTPTVTNGVISFAYGSGSGTATITVVAKNLDGTSATTSFAVTVPNSATPGAGPVAAPVAPPFVVTGNNQSFGVLSQATDSKAPLLPSSVTIVTSPTHGSASVNSSDGSITYVPAAGYTGTDTLSFTVADTSGNVSAPQTATLTVAPTAATVTIGGPGQPKVLTFTQPDGVVGHLTVKGSNATVTVTFADYRVTMTQHGSAAFASGAGTDIAKLSTTDFGPYGRLKLLSNGPVTISSIDGNALAEFYAPSTTLTGLCQFFGVGKMTLAALNNAQLFTGSYYNTELLINSVTNSSVTANYLNQKVGNFSVIKSKQWLNTNGGTYNISAGSVFDLEVPGTFDENLALTGTGYSLYKANVGKASGNWGMSGSIFKLGMKSPASTWSLKSNGLVKTLAIKGDLTNNQITAAAITTMTVSGTTTGAVVQTDATFSAKFNQIEHISFGRNVSNTVIFSAGNIGTISAPNLINSRIYAGVNLTVAQNGVLAASATDLSDNAKIAGIFLGRGANAFSNSLISADILNSLQLGRVATSNGGTIEGISAHTIGSISATLVPGGVLKAGRAQLKTAAALAAYEKSKKLSLGDFAINLF